MNWDALGAIGETIGAIGVIVTLIYLAAQIKQNSAWLKATVLESASERSGAVTSSVYADPDLSRIIRVGYTGDAESLTLEEKHRFSLVMARAMRGHEINFAHYKSGLLNEESFNGLVANMTVWISSPLFDTWWETASQIYRSDFREKVDEIRNSGNHMIYDMFREKSE